MSTTSVPARMKVDKEDAIVTFAWRKSYFGMVPLPVAAVMLGLGSFVTGAAYGAMGIGGALGALRPRKLVVSPGAVTIHPGGLKVASETRTIESKSIKALRVQEFRNGKRWRVVADCVFHTANDEVPYQAEIVLAEELRNEKQALFLKVQLSHLLELSQGKLSEDGQRLALRLQDSILEPDRPIIRPPDKGLPIIPET